jgi:hypothetical protein
MAAFCTRQTRQTKYGYSAVTLFESVVPAKLANEWFAVNSISLWSHRFLESAGRSF